jgi:phosphatidate cytidylyltransferase
MIAVLLADVRVMSLVLGIMAVIGLSEIYNATGTLKKHNKLCMFTYIYTMVMYIVVGFLPKAGTTIAAFTFVYIVLLFIYMMFHQESYEFSSICSMVFQFIYVGVFFAHIILVRKLESGAFIMWFIFVTAWLSDTMAYAVGLKFGRNKLLPTVSPKKTVEGAIGGLAGSLIFNLIYALIVGTGLDLNVNYFAVVILAILAGVVSQFGDLAASTIKREYNIKDYSNLLPGHGGILDRFDSVLFVAPIVYYFVVIFSVVA